jgi:hypothetical protein
MELSLKKDHLAHFFDMKGEDILLEEKDLGLFNGMMTTNVPYSQVLEIKGMWAPPYLSSDFLCEVRLFGQTIKTKEYTWSPRQLNRIGNLNKIAVQSTVTLAKDCRAVVMAFTLMNQTDKAMTVPLSLNISGTFAQSKVWDFYKQRSEPAFGDPYNYSSRTEFSEKEGRIIWGNDAGAVVIKTNIKKIAGDGYCPRWNSVESIKAKQCRTYYISIAMGEKSEAIKTCLKISADPKRAISRSTEQLTNEIKGIFQKLPTFKSSNKELQRLYARSLVLFLMNRWHVPEFELDPYYSTGGVNGGCVCSYLYDFSEGWEIMNLYDPQALKEHIRKFLNMGLGKHFAFLPLTGESYGPWYPVNQEKIIFLVYYYVNITGDKDFLLEIINGKSVLKQLIEQATHCDNLNKPVALIDYGDGNNHLELQRQYKYNNYLPDLNARRYANYRAVSSMCKISGMSDSCLDKRAEQLKVLIKNKMWDKKIKWFHHFDKNWEKDTRYTVQMFKLIGSGVLDKQQQEGLLGHLNEKEFLSEHGLHSMSKQDIAFDQYDIDNGGGGICTCFPPQIIERLYKASKPKYAEDILKRILWWGKHLPYWGDSLVASAIDYRRDTPLQNAIGGISVAQSIIFGMFGVQVNVDGQVAINPAPPSFSPKISLEGLKIRGNCFDIFVTRKTYKVEIKNITYRSKIGEKMCFDLKGKMLNGKEFLIDER